MPRALVVTHYFAPHVGGIETVAAEQVSGLRRHGWDVELHTTAIPTKGATERTPGSCRRFAALNVLEERFGVPVPLPTPWMLVALVRAAARADVVVAHGHVYPTSMYAAMAARRARVPLVVVQHNPFVEYSTVLDGIERLMDATAGRWVLRAAQRVVCVSRFTEQYVRRIASSAPTVVVANGVDTSRFRRADMAPTHGDDGHAPRRVVTLRRLVGRNGIVVLLDAWALADLDDRAELVIGGTGPEEDDLRRRSERLRGVRFVGRVGTAEHAAFYQGAWVAVMPTVTGEGFGLMAAEAMACGVPVIATRQGALPEIVRDGDNGMLVPANDAAALARALRAVVVDDAHRARLAAGTARATVSWDTSVDRFHAVLLDVLGEVA